MKSSTMLLLIMCFSTLLFSQKNDLLFTNSQLIDEDRYKEMDYSPYLFKEWVHGNITAKSNTEEAIENVLLNYNGYTKSFEVRKDNRFIELEGSYYSTIAIPTEDMVFKLGMHPTLQDRFMRIVYEGKSIAIVQDFVVSLQKREKKLYGKVNIVSEFIKRPMYYVIRDNKATVLKLKKKTIMPLLDNNKQVAAYIKKEGLKMKSEEDLVQVLRVYEKDTRVGQVE